MFFFYSDPLKKENKLKASLSRKVVDKKKEMYSSISTMIQKKMSAGYESKSAFLSSQNPNICCMKWRPLLLWSLILL